MLDFQQKKKMRRMVYSKVSVVVLLLVTLLLLKGGVSMYQKEKQSRQNMIEVEKKLANAKLRQAELENNLNRLNSPDGVENEIRTKYNVKKAGEEVVLVVESQATSTTTVREKGFWSKISDWISGIF